MDNAVSWAFLGLVMGILGNFMTPVIKSPFQKGALGAGKPVTPPTNDDLHDLKEGPSAN